MTGRQAGRQAGPIAGLRVVLGSSCGVGPRNGPGPLNASAQQRPLQSSRNGLGLDVPSPWKAIARTKSLKMAWSYRWSKHDVRSSIDEQSTLEDVRVRARVDLDRQWSSRRRGCTGGRLGDQRTTGPAACMHARSRAEACRIFLFP